MTHSIVIFDDETSSAAEWKAMIEQLPSLTDRYTVEIVDNDTVSTALEGLEERRRKAREGNAFDDSLRDNPFDKAGVLVVDYDLLFLAPSNKETSNYLTGEGIAYLARCFSSCGIVLALNQYGFNNFDLTLRGHPESFADINLGGKQLANRGLWFDQPTDFRPWAWPLVPFQHDAFEKRVEWLVDHLDEPILKSLGFPANLIPMLPRAVVEFIDLGRQAAKAVENITFREFATRSENGYRGKDAPIGGNVKIPDTLIARVAAARVGKWLERLVLPGQDILVDAPHLVSRYPSLLEGDPSAISTWDATASLASPKIAYDRIAEHVFAPENWLSRPAWWWNSVKADEDIPEVVNPWAKTKSDFVFCEDISRFLSRSDAQEFVADLPSPFVRRYAAKPEAIPSPAKEILLSVDYRPEVRFAL